MGLDQYRLKLKRNKPGSSENQPGYSLSYKTKALNSGKTSYDILSALAGNSDVVIELNTDIFFGSAGSGHDQALAFADAVRARNIALSVSEVQSERRASYFGIPIEGKKKSKALRVAAYVPNLIWKDESFHEVLPACGGRYCIADQPMDEGSILNDLWNIPDEEKLRMFRMVIFNMAEFGQMGIATASVTEDELKRLLCL